MKKIVLWHHGTKDNNWKDSGWVYDGKLYPCEYSSIFCSFKGLDKIIGAFLLKYEEEQKSGPTIEEVKKHLITADLSGASRKNS
jgi:hypothetical protein